MKAVLGIDIAKARFEVALMMSAVEKFKTHVFANTQDGFDDLRRWLSKQGVRSTHACLEATGRYGEKLAQFLFDHGHRVSVLNPHKVKSFGQSLLIRNKSDSIDARLIALYARRLNPAAWQPAPVEITELKALVDRLEQLKNYRQQERNRLDGAAQPVRSSLQSMICTSTRKLNNWNNASVFT